MKNGRAVFFILFLLEMVLSALLVFSTRPYYELSFRLWILAIFGLIDFWIVLYKKYSMPSKLKWIVSIPVTLLSGMGIFILTSNVMFIWNEKISGILIFLLITTKIYYYILILISRVIYLYSKEFSFAKYKYDTLAIVSLLFFFWIFIPTEIYVNNYLELEASYFVFIRPLIFCFFFSLICIFTLFLGTARKFLIRVFFYACEIGAYVQYLFFNKHLSILNGLDYNINVFVACANIAVWIFIIIVIFIFEKKNNAVHIVISFIFGIQLLTTIYLIVFAPAEIWNNRSSYEMADKQYMVAKEKNTVVFVLDAVDNHYIKELLASNDEVFDYYNDFTLYTNTCSVFDVTLRSMPQMFSGSDYSGKMIDYSLFYDRLHDNDYEIRFYNYEEDRGDINLYKYLDNYRTILADDESFFINHYKIVKYSGKLSFYIMLPDILKNIMKPSDINFKNVITIKSGDYTSTVDYGNRDFDEKLMLTIDDDYKNAFIMQHIEGAHWPCQDYVGETKYCLQIVNKYMQQLKDYGLYDDSTIIITSDHGWQDDGDYPPYPTAGTPMFMIKSPGSCNENILINDAPIYHTDFLSTILINAGLYDFEEDKNIFGPSIYDYEGKQRTRIWVNRSDEKYYKYCVYTYTGDTAELEKIVNEGVFEKMY